MLEFAHAHWLWLLAFAVALYAAYLLARRFRPLRVTYGHVWHSVARKLRPPGWKRLLRTLLTWLVAALILSCTVLFASGLQRSTNDLPAPLLVAIALDCTPSMAATGPDGISRLEHGHNRAQQIVDALGPADRAIFYHFEQGRPAGTGWLSVGDRLPALPALDFYQPDLDSLEGAVRAWTKPQAISATAEPVRFIWWLSDQRPARSEIPAPARLSAVGGTWCQTGGTPLLVETFGHPAANDGISSVRLVPGTDGSGPVLEVSTRNGGQLVHHPPLPNSNAPAADGSKGRFRLPLKHAREVGVVRMAKPDALALDDSVEYRLADSRLGGLTFWHPPDATEVNPYLVAAIGALLPGVPELARPSENGIVVMDRVAPATPVCRAAVCFGAIPATWGRLGEPVAIRAGFQQAAKAADFDLPDLSLLSAAQVWPLVDSALTPLLRDPAGNVLLADGMLNNVRVLYCGFVPHLSTFLNDQGEVSGLLLLMRWLQAVQAPRDFGIPPFLGPGQHVTLRLPTPGPYLAERAGSATPATTGPRAFRLPAGTAQLGPFAQPDTWNIFDPAGTRLGTVAALWSDDQEQAIAFTPLSKADLQGLNPASSHDWRDTLPHGLLYLLLGLVLLEWLLWLAGVTE
ncbi:MAG: hypothetical protein KF754_15485 [Planctomycetes bacterium]|nr:hypothetical protein [Planctomycetota bacterium]